MAVGGFFAPKGRARSQPFWETLPARGWDLAAGEEGLAGGGALLGEAIPALLLLAAYSCGAKQFSQQFSQ